LIKVLAPGDKRYQAVTDDQANTDNYLILAAYEKWGPDCVNHLLGDFAFIICDARAGQLFAARDPFGARPLFYHCGNDRFIFFSRIIEAASWPEIPLEINEEKAAGFLIRTLGGANPSQTWFRGVQRLPPAHVLKVHGNGLRKMRYWHPDPERALSLPSDEEYADAFEEVFDRAVGDRLRGPGSTASMLSGGLDSSTIVGLACRQRTAGGSGPLATYSGITNEPDCLETHYVGKVIKHCAVEPRLVSPSDVSQYERELERADAYLEDPMDQAWSLLKLLILVAGKDGHKRMLSGLGGDMVASLGPDYPAYLLRSGRWLTAARELKGQHRNYYRRSTPTVVDYFRLVRRAVAPAALRRLKLPYVLTHALQKMQKKSLIADSLTAGLGLEKRLLKRLESEGLDLAPSLRHAHAMDIDVLASGGGAEMYGRLASGSGMECRHPLLDRCLVEFCLSLPWDQKCRDGWSKFVMRRVAERVLPNEVAWRPGWEEISWKFTAAQSQLNREEELDTAAGLARAYSSLVSAEKVDQRIRRLARKEVDYDWELIEFLGLARWLKRLGIERL
jgi:asparagine synthase (glutamine-hydrolysing)